MQDPNNFNGFLGPNMNGRPHSRQGMQGPRGMSLHGRQLRPNAAGMSSHAGFSPLPQPTPRPLHLFPPSHMHINGNGGSSHIGMQHPHPQQRPQQPSNQGGLPAMDPSGNFGLGTMTEADMADLDTLLMSVNNGPILNVQTSGPAMPLLPSSQMGVGAPSGVHTVPAHVPASRPATPAARPIGNSGARHQNSPRRHDGRRSSHVKGGRVEKPSTRPARAAGSAVTIQGGFNVNILLTDAKQLGKFFKSIPDALLSMSAGLPDNLGHHQSRRRPGRTTPLPATNQSSPASTPPRTPSLRSITGSPRDSPFRGSPTHDSPPRGDSPFVAASPAMSSHRSASRASGHRSPSVPASEGR